MAWVIIEALVLKGFLVFERGRGAINPTALQAQPAKKTVQTALTQIYGLGFRGWV